MEPDSFFDTILAFNKMNSGNPRYHIEGKNQVFDVNIGEAVDYGLHGGIGQLRKEMITDRDIDHKVLRNPVASNQIMRMMEDPFGGGFEIQSDNTKLQDMANQFIKQTKFDKMVQRAYAYSRAYGAGFLFLDLAMRFSEGREDPVTNFPKSLVKETSLDKNSGTVGYDFSKLIRKVVPMPRKQVKEPVIDKETGEIIAWKVYLKGNWGSDEIIHADRMIHLEHWYMSGTWKGRSWLEPQFNALNDFEDASVTVVETLIKCASGYIYLKIPFKDALSGSLPDIDRPKVSSADIDKAEEIVKNPHVKKSAVIDQNWDMGAVDMRGGMNPSPFLREIKQAISMGGRIPSIIMSGSEAGQLTGYEWVVKQFHKWVNLQRTNYEEYFFDYLTRFQKWGVLPKGSMRLKWGEIDAPTAKERGELFKLEAQGQATIVNSIEKMANMGWTVAGRDGKGNWIKEDQNGQVWAIPIIGCEMIQIDDMEAKDLYLEDIGIKYGYKQVPPNPNQKKEEDDEEGSNSYSTNSYKLTKEERDKLWKDWGISDILDAQIPSGENSLNTAIWDAFYIYWADITKILADNGIEPVNEQYTSQTMEAILDSMEDLPFDEKETIRKNLEDMANRALAEGYNDMALKIGFPDSFDPGSEYAKQFLLTNIKPLTNGIKTDITSALERAMADGLSKGFGYQKIFRSMEGATGKYTKSSVGKVVHKVVHNAVNSARIQAGRDGNMIKPGDQLLYITQGDDRVRPEHRAREGNLYSPQEMEVLLSEWACRCTWTYQLAIERLRGQTLGREDFIQEP